MLIKVKEETKELRNTETQKNKNCLSKFVRWQYLIWVSLFKCKDNKNFMHIDKKSKLQNHDP